MKVIKDKELISIGTYKLHCVPVKNNTIPQIIITVPENYNAETIDIYTFVLLSKVINDNPKYNSKFSNYERFLDDSLS